MYRIITNANRENFADDAFIVYEINNLVATNPTLRTLITSFIGPEVFLTEIDFTDKSVENKDKILRLSGNLVGTFGEQQIEMLRVFSSDVLLTGQEINNMYTEFKDHYSHEAKPADEVFSDVRINWPELNDNINKADNPSSVAYKFIHRFNSTEKNWFLTAQQKELSKYGDFGNYTPLIRGVAPMFNIQYTGNAEAVDPKDVDFKNLKTDVLGNYYDELYQSEIAAYGDNADPVGTAYSDTDRVWSVTLPAQELRLLVTHNRYFGGAESEFEINFKCITYEIPNAPPPPAVLIPSVPDWSKVNYPHCVAVYASRNGVAVLVPGAVVTGAVFRGRGGNLDSLCPPNCNKYYWPINLPA